MEDSINAYILNFDPETGTIIIPDVYSEVVSSDAKFEVTTNVEAKKLVIERQSDVVAACDKGMNEMQTQTNVELC